MPHRTVFLFPGLGAYSTGVLRQARRDFPRIDRTFQEIDSVCAEHDVPPVSVAMFGERELSVHDLLGMRSELLQLAIFGTSLATFQVLADEGVRPDLVVGHSFGEIPALVAAGAFTLADGVRIVCARTAALREWEGRGRMAALGASEIVATHLIGVLDEPELVVGCVNAPRQSVISGPADAIDRLERAAKALDFPFALLDLPYASHHPSMRPAVDEFVRLLGSIRQQRLGVPVYSPIHDRRYTDNDDLKQAIADCLVTRVRFADAVRDLHARGYERFVECGARHALTHCVELTVPGVWTHSPLADPAQESVSLRGAGHDEPPRASTAAEIPVPRAGREETLGWLRAIYAAALEYPPEVFTEDAQLEAELGVDSLKQTSLLTRVMAEFELPGQELRVWEFPTLGRIADHVLAGR